VADGVERGSSPGQFRRIETLDERLHRDFSQGLLLRRFASVSPDAVDRVPPPLAQSQAEELVRDAFNALVSVTLATKDARLAIRQVEVPPPANWLSELDIPLLKFVQVQVDTFSVLAYSTIDRVLLLVNVVCGLDIPPRECSFGAVAKRIASGEPRLFLNLQELRKLTSDLAEARHLFVHRGEGRAVDVFSDVRRLDLILEEFSLPRDSVELNVDGAQERAVIAMTQDAERIEEGLRELKGALLGIYDRELARLGGISLPDKETIEKALAVLRWFAGGPEPIR